MKEPHITVGILSGKQIRFSFPESFNFEDNSVYKGYPNLQGEQIAWYNNGRIEWNDHLYNELVFVPLKSEVSFFELKDVIIGINFHWERKENQRFRGALKLIVENDKLTAVNIVNAEDYLTSVISSEMSATASAALLKAHAIISRSWLLAQLKTESTSLQAHQRKTGNDELIKWYGREAHTHFNVCADDHCQRYQGITRASTPQAIEAVSATRGQVLTSEGEICDARFSKCCGGAFEEFQNCWENVKHPYLIKQRDSKTETALPDLRIESEAEEWIRNFPTAFCDTTDKHILSQVLNNYDQETIDFYRWSIAYTQEELSTLIEERLGIDFGQIIDLIPVERGVSGRLVRLKIIGSKQTRIIGKELEIRRTLSSSHLYSSAFVVDKEIIMNGIPEWFILTGAGWGHGVGLCQIGAAMMGEQGYNYEEILLHYYHGATIETLYK